MSDADAAQFFLARMLSGFGELAGLVVAPTAMAIAPNGAILVLEQGNNRIQAFDLGGNPVKFFKQQPDPHFLELEATDGAAYLDLAVEFTGYLYGCRRMRTTRIVSTSIIRAMHRRRRSARRTASPPRSSPSISGAGRTC